MTRTIHHKLKFECDMNNLSFCRTLARAAAILVVTSVVSMPSFAASACDSLVGEFSKVANGDPWLRISKKGDTYSASTHGHLFGKSDATSDWNDEPATSLKLISDERLAAGAEMNGNKTPVAGMCGLSGGRIIIIKVPIGYRYGQEPDEVAKTGYVLAVYADENGYGTMELYPH